MYHISNYHDCCSSYYAISDTICKASFHADVTPSIVLIGFNSCHLTSPAHSFHHVNSKTTDFKNCVRRQTIRFVHPACLFYYAWIWLSRIVFTRYIIHWGKALYSCRLFLCQVIRPVDGALLIRFSGIMFPLSLASPPPRAKPMTRTFAGTKPNKNKRKAFLLLRSFGIV